MYDSLLIIRYLKPIEFVFIVKKFDCHFDKNLFLKLDGKNKWDKIELPWETLLSCLYSHTSMNEFEFWKISFGRNYNY